MPQCGRVACRQNVPNLSGRLPKAERWSRGLREIDRPDAEWYRPTVSSWSRAFETACQSKMTFQDIGLHSL